MGCRERSSTHLKPQKKVSARVGQKQYQKKYSKPDKRHQATDSRVSMELKHLKYKENCLKGLTENMKTKDITSLTKTMESEGNGMIYLKC